MANASHHGELVGWVRQVLQAPVRVKNELLTFMETTFGMTDLTALPGLHDSEAASFVDLLFYPDRQVQLAYERHWGEQAIHAGDIEALLEALLAQPITATLQTDDPAAVVTLQVPAFAVAAFVERLRMTWQAPARLSEVLHAMPDESARFAVRAQLRQSRVGWHAGRIQLLELFLTRMTAAEDDFDLCLRFLLSILGELGPADASFDFLSAKKLAFFQSLCQCESFEQRRREGNMEILMLQGTRACHGDIGQWRDRMRLVDRICLALFGRTRFFQRPVDNCVTVKDLASDGRMETLFRELS